MSWQRLEDFEMDDVKFTIYNWKDGYIPTEEYEWHIGGYGFDAVDNAYEIINVEIIGALIIANLVLSAMV